MTDCFSELASSWSTSLEAAAQALSVRPDDVRGVVAPTFWTRGASAEIDPSDIARLVANRPDALVPVCRSWMDAASPSIGEVTTVSNTDDVLALTGRALWAAKQGWWEEAEGDLGQAVARSAFDGDIWFCAGIVRVLAGDISNASDGFLKAARYLGKDRPASSAFALISAATALELAGEATSAVSTVESAVESAPYPEVRLALARLKHDGRDLSGALCDQPSLVFDAVALDLTLVDEQIDAALEKFRLVVEAADDKKNVLAQYAVRLPVAQRKWTELGGAGPDDPEPVLPAEPRPPSHLTVAGPASDVVADVIAARERLDTEKERYGSAVELFERMSERYVIAQHAHNNWERRRELVKEFPRFLDAPPAATADNLLQVVARRPSVGAVVPAVRPGQTAVQSEYRAAPAYARPYSGTPVVTARETNGMAIAAMVLGIVGSSVLALVFGYVARRQIDRSGGTQTGRGFATAGIVLGWIEVVALVIILIAATAASH